MEDRVVPAVMLRLEQGGFAPLTLADNGPGDANPAIGTVAYIGSYGTFLLNVSTVLSDPTGALDLNSTNIASSSGGTLTITAADTNYGLPTGNPLTLRSQIGGNIFGGQLTFQSWANPSNLSPLSVMPTVIPPGSVTPGPLGPFNSAPFAGGIVSTTFTSSGPYSLFSQVNLSFASSGTTGFDAFSDVKGNPSGVTIGDFVWNDTNANGIQDTGEAGIPNVSLTLTGTDSNNNPVTDHIFTDSSGYYLFTEAPGTYSVTVDASNFTGSGALVGYNASPTLQGADRSVDSNSTPTGTTPVTLPGGSSDLTLDFGYYKPVNIGDFVWNDANGNGIQDVGEAGINGVTLTLTGTTGTGAPVTQTTTTAGNGGYLFSNLPPGTYTVTVDASNFTGTGALVGYTPTPTSQGGNPALDSNPNPTGTTPGTLSGGTSDLTLDFGYYKPVSVGDFVWNDANGNGIQDSGEAGINGVTLTLTGTTGAGVPVTQTTTTAGNGGYLFSNLPPGTYTVSVNASNFTGAGALVGYTATPTLVGPDRAIDSNPSPTGTTPAALPGGSSDLTLDFGYYKPVSIGDFVWNDANGNGIQDSGEAGINGVTLTLTGTTGTGASVTQTTTTAGNGGYLFSNLPPGTYTVTVDVSNFTGSGALVGYTASPTLVGSNRAVDSNNNPSGTSPAALPGGTSDLTVDFGYYKPVRVGDFVWNDKNANGIQESGEVGIAGVFVQLTGIDALGNTIVRTTTTDLNGLYSFNGLPPGTYTVTVASGGALTGYTASPTLVGPNPAVDSNPNPTGTTPTFLLGGGSDLTLDFGYYQTVKIGDFVWKDTNGNGIQDLGEPGINGVTLTLTGTTGYGSPVTQTTTTAGNGGYLFSNLPPGTYTVTVDASNFASGGALDGYIASPTLQGGDTTKDSNPNPSGTTPAALPGGSCDLTLDFGYYLAGSISGTKWLVTEEPGESGRMTGGGSVFAGVGDSLPVGTRVTHGFELHCDPLAVPNNLEINWIDPSLPSEQNFHLSSVTKCTCLDTSLVQLPPAAPFDTMIGVGKGTLNGIAGYGISYTLTDAGEPGTGDSASYLIWKDTDNDGNVDGGEQVVLNIGPRFLTYGNQQAHAENKVSSTTGGTPILTPFANVWIHLVGVAGTPTANVDQHVQTDVNGNYSFSNLALGAYQVFVEEPPGYVETYPILPGPSPGAHAVIVPGDTMGPVGYDVALTTSSFVVTGRDFHDMKLVQPEGRMTGGGSVFTGAGDIVNGVTGNAAVGLRVTHGFELHCDPLINPQNLQINWHDVNGKESHFHLLNVTSCTCLDTPIIQRPPDAPIDTLIAKGNGRFSGTFNGVKYSNAENFTIEWTFTDGGPIKGEPGIYDTATYLIKDPLGNIVLKVSPKLLTFGNHQAHFENKTPPSSGVNMIHNQIDRTFNALDNDNNQDDTTVLALNTQLQGLFDQYELAWQGVMQTLYGSDTTNNIWVISGAGLVSLNGTPYSGVQNILGGALTDTLTGPNAANTWNITANNAGTVAGINFTGIENLTGGSSSDIFVFTNGKSVSGKIDGKGGINTLDYSAFTNSVTVNLASGAASNTGGLVLGSIQNVYGGGNNDTIYGDAQANILVGNGSNDYLRGGDARDIMIGGDGTDTLVGDAADDILIAGYTSYDANTAALQAIMAEWTSARSYVDRVQNLLGNGVNRTTIFSQRLNGGYFLNGDDALGGLGGQTVFNDNKIDSLYGCTGIDWFLANTYKDGGKTETADVIYDLAGGETASDSDYNKL